MFPRRDPLVSKPLKGVDAVPKAPKCPSDASVRPPGQKVGRNSGNFAHLLVELLQGYTLVLFVAPGRLYPRRTTVTNGRSSAPTVVNPSEPGQPGFPALQDGGLFDQKAHLQIELAKAIKELPLSPSNSLWLLRTALIRCRSGGEPLSADPPFSAGCK